MDSNNFSKRSGMGEREARIVCELVRKRHYNFAHGIGRSGNLTEAQPKAAGSTIMNNLTNSLLLDLIREIGVRSCRKALLVPMATGMSVMLTLLVLKAKRPNAKFVLWSRIDQKSCFKSILSSGLLPIVIDTIPTEECNGAYRTNIAAFQEKIEEFGSDNICCILSTTSCFAPRMCDDIIALSGICRDKAIPHLVNNAYGLQSTYLTHQLEQAARVGRVDAFIQSTDKNLLVPVGGAIIAGFDSKMIDQISEFYPGRASSSQTLDVLMTLLSIGRDGYKNLMSERRGHHQYLLQQMKNVADIFDETVIAGKNPISIAMTLKNFSANPVLVGSMLQRRGISGCRVISGKEVKTIGPCTFNAWGAHSDLAICCPYLTASAALGIDRKEIDVFIAKLKEVLKVHQKDTQVIV
ncbi:O-phosphoseryl-tRNA(Sec) selenium transferase isoform X2 [Toxorhynchites rutilus septentrionalis]|nr:O-phosphoseryl-tRNA(Sec) selenium transferase isoform X2 [Toxorhynchites rutilus septentrionalis]